eukprot:5058538-Prymnesium_polylepis.1
MLLRRRSATTSRTRALSRLRCFLIVCGCVVCGCLSIGCLSISCEMNGARVCMLCRTRQQKAPRIRASDAVGHCLRN